MARKPTISKKKVNNKDTEETSVSTSVNEQTNEEAMETHEAENSDSQAHSNEGHHDLQQDEIEELNQNVQDLEDEAEEASSEEEVPVDQQESVAEEEESTASGSQSEEKSNTKDDIESTIFIKGLDYDVTEETLRDQMECLGEVIRVTVPKTHDNRRNKGFAYVQFATAEQCQKALKLNDTEFMGRTVVVSQAKPRSNRKIYTVFVRNISFDTSKDELQDYFNTFGEVYNISIPTDPENPSRNRGFAFIEYTDESIANKVAEFKHKMGDKQLYTKLGNKNQPRNDKRGSDRLYGRKNGGYDRKDDNRERKGRRDDYPRNKSFNRDDNDSFRRKGDRFKDSNKSKKIKFDE